MAAGPNITMHDTLDGLRPAWEKLAEVDDSIFSTWEWLDTWWRKFGRERPLLVATWSDAGSGTTGIIPMYLAARYPVRVLRLMGHGPSDRLGPICGPGERDTAALVWTEVLESRLPGWDMLLADELPATNEWATALGGVRMARQASPVARLAPDGWEAWLAARSRNFRATLTRAGRRLDAHGTVRYRTTTDPDRVAHDLSQVMRLHTLRWAGTGSRGGFAGREAFHRECCRTAFRRGWLRLRFAEIDGRPVGALYNLAYGRNESFYLSGRDPAVQDASVGLLLQAYAIRQAHAEGREEYRFLRGSEPYKYRFADEDHPLEAVAVTRSPAGRAAVRGLRDFPRFPAWARRRVPAPFAWGTGASPRWGRP